MAEFLKKDSASSSSSSSSPTHHNITAHDEDFPNVGVKLHYIESELLPQWGGRSNLEKLTTAEVCEKYLKPMTKVHSATGIPATAGSEPEPELLLSLCELLQRQNNHSAIGTAQVFISHAWKYIFLDVIDALQSHFEEQPDIVIWFDLFSNNQHKAVSKPFEFWTNTFKSSIQELGHTVMILSPWNDPIPYTRAWCIFEAYATADTGAKFEIAMNKSHHDQFIKDVEADPKVVLNEMLAAVNAEKSECFLAEDRERIFETIRATVGFHEINAMLHTQLRKWVISVAEAALQANNNDAKHATLLNILASAYFTQGDYKSATPLYEECFQTRCKFLGDMHPDTLHAQNALAYNYMFQDLHSKALPLFEDCYAKRKEVLGRTHPHTLLSMNNLASQLRSMKDFTAAELLFEECLALRESELGSNHVDTLVTLNNLAILYQANQDYDRAQYIYEDCLQKRKDKLGENHPETMASLNNIAMLYMAKGDLTRALPLFEDTLRRRTAILGEFHPQTLRSVRNYEKCERLLEIREKEDEFELFNGKSNRATSDGTGKSGGGGGGKNKGFDRSESGNTSRRRNNSRSTSNNNTSNNNILKVSNNNNNNFRRQQSDNSVSSNNSENYNSPPRGQQHNTLYRSCSTTSMSSSSTTSYSSSVRTPPSSSHHHGSRGTPRTPDSGGGGRRSNNSAMGGGNNSNRNNNSNDNNNHNHNKPGRDIPFDSVASFPSLSVAMGTASKTNNNAAITASATASTTTFNSAATISTTTAAAAAAAATTAKTTSEWGITNR